METKITAPSFDGSQLCAKVNPEVFFPEMPEIPSGLSKAEKKALKFKYLSTLNASVEKAKAICNHCAFVKPCLEYALQNDVVGVWAATTQAERKKIRKEQGLPNPKSMALFMDSVVK